MAIMKLIPASKDYIWGGRKLIDLFGKASSAERMAESWELSCHPDGQSLIGSGRYAGSTLAGYLAFNAKQALGSSCARFDYQMPVLIKLIDSAQPLSVQVHPDDAYAHANENGQNGKTEMWHIIDCEPDAFIYFGVNREVSREELAEAIRNNTVEGLLSKTQVAPGDTYFIEAGTIHAIGAGIVLAEIQQNSNLTYRLYDYDRRSAQGVPRRLHIEQGVVVSRLTPSPKKLDFGGHLALCEYFCTDKLTVNTETALTVGDDSFLSLLITHGSGIISNGGDTLRFVCGDSLFIPAGSGAVTITGDAQLLATTIPAM